MRAIVLDRAIEPKPTNLERTPFGCNERYIQAAPVGPSHFDKVVDNENEGGLM